MVNEASRRVGTGQRGVTLRDVARACGLSVYPVSRALAGLPGVTPETVARVRTVAAELGYNAGQNHAAKSLAARKTGKRPVNHVLGLLMPSHLGRVRFFVQQFQGIVEVVSGSGYGLLVVPSYDTVAQQDLPIELPPSVLRGEVDGLITHITPPPELVRYLRLDTAFGDRPIVTMTAQMADAPAVLRDERGGARLALEHLLASGHRRVGYLRRPAPGYPMTEREEAYREVCAEAGLNPDTTLVPIHTQHDDTVAEPLAEAFARYPDLTALLARSDPNALSAAYALQRLGRRVPEDVSLVGWDDTDPLPDACGRNLLTSVHFDIAELGRVAARTMIAAVATPDVIPPDAVLPASLRVRATTAQPPKRG